MGNAKLTSPQISIFHITFFFAYFVPQALSGVCAAAAADKDAKLLTCGVVICQVCGEGGGPR